MLFAALEFGGNLIVFRLEDLPLQPLPLTDKMLLWLVKDLTIAVFIFALWEEIVDRQHLFLATAFIYDIPGVGVPDIGTRFEISNPAMAASNAVLVLLLGAAIWGIAGERRWAGILLFLLAAFDIVAKFVFHGFFHITVSVIVSLVLIVVLMRVLI